MNFGRNEVTSFQFASTLTTTGQNILSDFGTAAADNIKKIRITDIKGVCGGTARTVEIGGRGGSYKKISLTFPVNSAPNYNFDMPYTLDCVSSTGERRGFYASASGAGVDIIISGFIERKS